MWSGGRLNIWLDRTTKTKHTSSRIEMAAQIMCHKVVVVHVDHIALLPQMEWSFRLDFRAERRQIIRQSVALWSLNFINPCPSKYVYDLHLTHSSQTRTSIALYFLEPFRTNTWAKLKRDRRIAGFSQQVAQHVQHLHTTQTIYWEIVCRVKGLASGKFINI